MSRKLKQLSEFESRTEEDCQGGEALESRGMQRFIINSCNEAAEDKESDKVNRQLEEITQRCPSSVLKTGN